MKILIVFLLCVAISAYPSTNVCQYSSKELYKVSNPQWGSVIVCGHDEGSSLLHEFTILWKKRSGDVKRIFESDSAMKEYTISKIDSGFRIKEGPNIKDSRPYIAFDIHCTENDCKSTNYSCIWKAEKMQKNVMQEISKLKDKKGSDVYYLDNLIVNAFYAVLNGDKDALYFFKNGMKGLSFDGSASETYFTYKEEVSRLITIKCIK